jgi:hypothetical protein
MRSTQLAFSLACPDLAIVLQLIFATIDSNLFFDVKLLVQYASCTLLAREVVPIQLNMRVRSLSSREVEGNGPTKPGNPLALCSKGANSGGFATSAR